jgi:hypothetical protein
MEVYMKVGSWKHCSWFSSLSIHNITIVHGKLIKGYLHIFCHSIPLNQQKIGEMLKISVGLQRDINHHGFKAAFLMLKPWWNHHFSCWSRGGVHRPGHWAAMTLRQNIGKNHGKYRKIMGISPKTAKTWPNHRKLAIYKTSCKLEFSIFIRNRSKIGGEKPCDKMW